MVAIKKRQHAASFTATPTSSVVSSREAKKHKVHQATVPVIPASFYEPERSDTDGLDDEEEEGPDDEDGEVAVIRGQSSDRQDNDSENNEISNQDDDATMEDNEALKQEEKLSQEKLEEREVEGETLSTQDLVQMASSADLFKSNLFKLQINELLKQVSVDFSKTSKLEKALRFIKLQLDLMPDIPEQTVRTQLCLTIVGVANTNFVHLPASDHTTPGEKGSLPRPPTLCRCPVQTGIRKAS